MLSSRGQNILEANLGLGLKHLASIWLSYYVTGHFSGKNCLKFGYFVNVSGNNLKSYVVNQYLVLFTARCTLVQSAVLRSHVVCLSVCNVGEL